MSLFSRLRAPEPPAAEPAGAGRKKWGHAAFAEADVEDARRGHPVVSLDSFAAATGLERRRSEVAGAFLSTLPVWGDYIFDIGRGAMPSGRFGQVVHELFEQGAHNGDVFPDGLHDLKVKRFGPYVEVGGIQVNIKNEPFAADSVWIPTTTVHIRATETTRLPLIRITRFGPSRERDNNLDRFGLPGFHVMEGDEDESLLAAITDALRPWLMTRPDPYINLRVRYGVVALTVNGYRADHADLQHLVAIADGIAEVLGRLTPPPSETPFATLGPPASTVRMHPGIPLPHRRTGEAYAELAARLGMFNEDISHLMALVPRCPIPGMPSGVLAGRLPGSRVPVRFVWSEHGGHTSNTFRGAAIMPARVGATTPLGGVVVASTDMYVEVVDGYVACWRKQRSIGALESAELLERATTTLRASGLAAI